MDESERQRRHALDEIREHHGGFTHRKFEGYVEAVHDFTPAAVEEGVRRLIREWTMLKAPTAGKVREYCQAAANRRGDTPGGSRTRGDGVGCPDCRREYPEGRHAEWVGDGTVIACREHPWTWRGSTHLPDEVDPGPVDVDDWRARALLGEFGDVVGAAAARGLKPSDVQAEVTRRLQEVR